MHAVSYNSSRTDAEAASGISGSHAVSFKGTVDTLRHWKRGLEAMRGMPRKQKALLDYDVRSHRLTTRSPSPEREEPAREKAQAKNYHLLTKPRTK